ncbi:MAG: hypothetical protein WC209_01435 [Ignavibacteriaceae bacterium]|jgi:hypothetical protein
MKKYFLPIAILVSIFSMYGCYTQVDFRDRHRDDYEYSHDQDRNDNYSENDSQSYSDGESDVTINNYYDGYYPGYRRYLWHNYYPSFSIGFSYGPYWDNFCYDPWYYGYYPAIPVIAYYSPYYYDSYYYGGYYNNSYWNGGGSIYKERTNTAYRLRNNDGGRGTTTLRDRATRNLIQTSLSKDRQRTETLKRDVMDRTRESVTVPRNRDINNTGRDRTTISTDRPSRSAEVQDAVKGKRNSDQPAERNREIIRRDKPASSNPEEVRTTKPDRKESESPAVNTDRRRQESTSPSRGSSGERKKESYSTPRKESSQPRYEAPRSSNSGSSPRSSSPPSRGSSNSGSGSRDRRR